MSLEQSNSFEYRGLKVERAFQSATQSTYTVSLESEKIVLGPYDGEAPYDSKSFVHYKNDGRKNPWSKTDAEIKEGIDLMLKVDAPIFTTDNVYIRNLKKIRRFVAKLEGRKSEAISIVGKHTIADVWKDSLSDQTIDFLENFIVYQDKLEKMNEHLYNIEDAIDDIDDEEGRFVKEVLDEDKATVKEEVQILKSLVDKEELAYVRMIGS